MVTSKIPLANGKSLWRTCKIIGNPDKNGNQLEKDKGICDKCVSLLKSSAYFKYHCHMIIPTTKWMLPQQQSLVSQCWKFLKSCDKPIKINWDKFICCCSEENNLFKFSCTIFYSFFHDQGGTPGHGLRGLEVIHQWAILWNGVNRHQIRYRIHLPVIVNVLCCGNMEWRISVSPFLLNV